MKQIRVLVVDESPPWRDALIRALSGADDILPVGDTPSASAGLDHVRRERPHMVVLSVETPGLSAADFTRQALVAAPHLGVLLTARHGVDCEDQVIEALEAGAFDLILKADGREWESEPDAVMERRLLPKIRSFSAALYSRLARKISGSGKRITRPISSDSRRRAIDAIRNGNGNRKFRPEIIVAGVSTGGPEALSRLIPALPLGLRVPMVIVQHMPDRFIRSLASALDRRSAVAVRVVEHGEHLMPGVVYLAPGGKHMKLGRDGKGLLTCRLTDDPPENGFRPSADALFRSAAKKCAGTSSLSSSRGWAVTARSGWRN
jgi:two-component system chemotaxis response regulator CheB